MKLALRKKRRRGLKKVPLTVSRILEWADAFHERTGKWPKRHSGRILESAYDTWYGVDRALIKGGRGLHGGSSLARLLAARRGVRNMQALDSLTEYQILAWADAHRRRTGDWPTHQSGAVRGAIGETWVAINMAMSQGHRGLPGGSSLAQLLTARCGVRNNRHPPPFTKRQILGWAKAHHRIHGVWPTATSGPIEAAPGESWASVAIALYRGQRGMPGGSSLSRLLDTIRKKK